MRQKLSIVLIVIAALLVAGAKVVAPNCSSAGIRCAVT